MPTKTVKGAKRAHILKFEGDDIKNLKISPNLARYNQLTDSHIDQMFQTLLEGGALPPVAVSVDSSGTPELITGRHRHAATMRVNEEFSKQKIKKRIPLLAEAFYGINDAEAIEIDVKSNRALKMTAMDSAATIAKLQAIGYNVKQTAELLDINAATVGFRSRYNNLEPAVKDAIHSGKLKENLVKKTLQIEKDSDAGASELCMSVLTGDLQPSDIDRKFVGRRRAHGKIVPRTTKELASELRKIKGNFAQAFVLWLEGNPKIPTNKVLAGFSGLDFESDLISRAVEFAEGGARKPAKKPRPAKKRARAVKKRAATKKTKGRPRQAKPVSPPDHIEPLETLEVEAQPIDNDGDTTAKPTIKTVAAL